MDTNNSITISKNISENKIILLLMVKNESTIIKRCLSYAINHVDAVSILDTGSTDNTIDICKDFLSKSGKPFDINIELWQNFGYNRTISFQKCQEFCRMLEWNPENAYAFAIDADMCICPTPLFSTFKLTSNGYSIIQKNPIIEYYNVRLLKLSFNWKCVGATHEYWDGTDSDKIASNIIYIDDKNDGGCKHDKFERDIKLLQEELKENNENGRTHFYLAQSYKDIGRLNDAIKHYKKRIEIGGWYEEIWYSYYMISKCYMRLNNPSKMELWGVRAYEYYPKRAENLYMLCNYFRGVSQHYKSYHYYKLGKSIPYPTGDSLFIEKNVYHDLFDFENTILAFYIHPNNLQDGLHNLITFINNNNNTIYSDNVWKNIVHYIEPLISNTYRGQYTKYLFPNIDEYHSSSCSILYHNYKWIMNIRYVNYLITPDGSYNIKSEDGNVKTRNAFIYLNNNLQPISDITTINDDYVKYPLNIQGLEDIRLFQHNNQLMFTATSKDSSNNDNISITYGNYDINKRVLTNVTTLESPFNKQCEKNWIIVPDNNSNGIKVIYTWHPFQIGYIKDNQLELTSSHQTPRIFERFRGSSNLCEYLDNYWAVVHFVQYSMPRKYHHCLIQFNRNTLRPERYSLPFCFRKNAIEYCLALSIHDGNVRMIFSENDSDPGLIEVKLENMRFIEISNS